MTITRNFTYGLSLDTEAFKKQRSLLMSLASNSELFSPEVLDLLDGLVGLTDSIADQAYENYGLDTLLCSPEGEFYDDHWCDPEYPTYDAMPHPCEDEYGDDYRMRRNI